MLDRDRRRILQAVQALVAGTSYYLAKKLIMKYFSDPKDIHRWISLIESKEKNN